MAQPPFIRYTAEQFKSRLDKNDMNSVEEIKNDLKPFYWRIKKQDLGLKKPKYHRIPIRLKPYQKAIYDALATKSYTCHLIKAPEERNKLRIWRKAKMVRLLQAASNPTLLTQY